RRAEWTPARLIPVRRLGMRAMVLRGQDLSIEEMERPRPGPGQVLARVRACGICGSDLHAALYAEDMIRAARASGRTAWDGMDIDKGVVMGHEFVAEVVEVGAGAESWETGTRVTSIPVIMAPGTPRGMEGLGYSSRYPGAYGEYVVMSAQLL